MTPPNDPTPEEIAAKKAKQKEKNKKQALKRKEKKRKQRKRKKLKKPSLLQLLGEKHLHCHLWLRAAAVAVKRTVRGNLLSEAELSEYLETQQKRVYINISTPLVKMSQNN